MVYILYSNITVAELNKTNSFTNYLTSLKSVAMEFTQTDSRGKVAKGKIIILKPYRFRINYYSPYPLLMLGNKKEVIMYDYELAQTTRVDAKKNIFNFLLIEQKDWEKNFRIDSITEVGEHITAKLYNDDADRTIHITLNTKPLEIRKIIIDEPDGNMIEVIIENVSNISSADKDLFLLPNPDIFGKPKKLGKEEIEKKYR